MHYYRLVISYKGTHYFGWQDLGAGEDKPTVQASLQTVLRRIEKSGHFTVSAASRTDAGVHAQGQIVKISIEKDIEPEKLALGMNSLLPDDIRVLHCEHCTVAFNANRDSRSKEYHYYFSMASAHSAVLNDIVARIPPKRNTTVESGATAVLDLALMHQACKLFVGEHDFYSFAKRDTNISSTVRTIFSCEIVEDSIGAFGADVYSIRIVGTGFLKQMVRYMAGALFAVGRHELSVDSIAEALQQRQEKKLTPKAKPHGLHLIQICY